jgi:hypothetical protein
MLLVIFCFSLLYISMWQQNTSKMTLYIYNFTRNTVTKQEQNGHCVQLKKAETVNTIAQGNGVGRNQQIPVNTVRRLKTEQF